MTLSRSAVLASLLVSLTGCAMSEKPRPPIVELVVVRTKEFLRETEAIFWVFGFPLLLALALGFAFRAKAPDKIPIGVAAKCFIHTSVPTVSNPGSR